MDMSSKQKINKETQVLNDTLDEMDLTDIFRTFHPNVEEYTFFSSAHGRFSRTDHILGTQTPCPHVWSWRAPEQAWQGPGAQVPALPSPPVASRHTPTCRHTDTSPEQRGDVRAN